MVIIFEEDINLVKEERMAKDPKTIRGKKAVPGWEDSDLIIEVLDDNYEAYDKRLPDVLPDKTDGGESITWFNNFGVKQPGGADESRVPEYRVFLRELPNLPGGKPGKRRLCVYYDGVVYEVEPKGAGPERPGRVMFTLDVGDPPTGTIP
jgi:hypothetical protein